MDEHDDEERCSIALITTGYHLTIAWWKIAILLIWYHYLVVKNTIPWSGSYDLYMKSESFSHLGLPKSVAMAISPKPFFGVFGGMEVYKNYNVTLVQCMAWILVPLKWQFQLGNDESAYEIPKRTTRLLRFATPSHLTRHIQQKFICSGWSQLIPITSWLIGFPTDWVVTCYKALLWVVTCEKNNPNKPRK